MSIGVRLCTQFEQMVESVIVPAVGLFQYGGIFAKHAFTLLSAVLRQKP